MAQAVGALRIDLFANLAEFREGLNKAAGELRRFEKQSQRIASNFEGVGARLSLGLTVPLVFFATQAKDAARDAAELQSAFDISFGDMAMSANVWAEETGNAFGRSTQTLQKAAFAFNQLFAEAAPTEEAAFALSTAFAELSTDVASFFNLTEDDALRALRSGLAGEAEPLRRLGIFINAAAVESRAFELGIARVGDELTEQQKILARASLITEGLKDAQGDAVRTADGLANSERALKDEYQELLVTVGNELVPVFKELVAGLRDVIAFFKQLDPETRKTVLTVAALVAVIGPLLIALGSLIRVVGFAAAGLGVLSKSFGIAGASAAGARGKILGFAAALPIAFEAGKAAGNALFDLGKDNDAFAEAALRIPKLFGGAGASAKEAAERVKAYREQQRGVIEDAKVLSPLLEDTSGGFRFFDPETFDQVDDAQAAAKDIQALLAGLGPLGGADNGKDAAKLASELERLRGVIDPVGEALKQYNRDLGLARANGLLTAEAQAALADQFLSAAGGVEALTGDLSKLPPELIAAAEAAKALDLAPELDRVRAVVDPVGAALADYRADLELAEKAGIDATVAQRAFAEAMVDTLGGVEAVEGQLAQLPPVFAEVVAALKLEELAPEFERLRNAVDPVGAALKQYADDLALAEQAGISLAAAERTLALQFIESVGGLDALKGKLEELPPAIQAAAASLANDELQTELQSLAEDLNNRYATETNLQKRLMEVDDLFNRGLISVQVYTRAVQDLDGSARVFDDISDAIGDAILRGGDLEDSLKNIALELLRTQAITPFLDGLLKGGSGGIAPGGGLSGILGGLFGGFREKGGPTVGGMSYIVGEDGPELFTPNTSGTVSPNGSFSAGGTTIIQNITTPDADSFRRSDRQLARRAKRGLAND